MPFRFQNHVFAITIFALFLFVGKNQPSAYALTLSEDDSLEVPQIPDEQIPDGEPIPAIPQGIPLRVAPPGKPAFAGQNLLDTQQAALDGKTPVFKLSNVHFDGNFYTRTWVIEHALRPLYGFKNTPISLAQLNQTLDIINSRHIFQVKGELLKTGRKDLKELNLHIYEAQPVQLATTWDNQGRSRTGLYRFGMDVTDDNVLGLEDKLRYQYIKTVDESGYVAYRGAYQLPINRFGGSINLSGEWGNSTLTGTAFHSYPVLPPHVPPPPSNETQHTLADAGFFQPLNRSRNLQAHIGFAVLQLRLNEKTYPERVFYQGIHYVNPRPFGPLGMTQLHLFSLLDQKILGSRSGIWGIMLDASQVIRLPHDQLIHLRTHTQYLPAQRATGELSEPLTGEYAVRGYPEDLVFMATGTVDNVEYYFPIPFSGRIHPALPKRVKGVLFYDVGLGFFRGSTQDSFHHCLLNSLGVGLRVRLTQALQGFLDLGWGIGTANNFPGTFQNTLGTHIPPSFHLHFGIRSDLLPKEYRTHPSSLAKTQP